MPYRYACAAVAIVAGVLPLIKPAVGQERGTLTGLVQKACSGKTNKPSIVLEKLGINGPYRVLIERPSRTESKLLSVPENECLDGWSIQGQLPVLIISHTTSPGFVNHYLVSIGGELIRGLRGEGRNDGDVFSTIDISDQIIRTDFEAEKAFWMNKYLAR